MRDGVTAKVAGWVADLEFGQVPRSVLELTKFQILGAWAALHAGHFTEAGRSIGRLTRDWGGPREASFAPSGEKGWAPQVAWANAVLAATLEYEDYFVGGLPAAPVVMAALAAVETAGGGGKDLLLAIVAANEVSIRLGLPSAWQTFLPAMNGVVPRSAAAVAAGRLAGLDAAGLAGVLAHAQLASGGGSRKAFLGSDARAVVAGDAAEGGLRSATLAAMGLQAGLDPLDPSEGSPVLGGSSVPAAIWQNLGSVWMTETLSVKLYPGSAWIDGAIDGLLTLQRQHGFDARKVRSVHIATNSMAIELENLCQPFVQGAETPVASLAHLLRYNAAAALLDKELTARQRMRERVGNPAIWELAERIEVSIDETMTHRARERAPLHLLPGDPPPAPDKVAELARFDPASFRVSAGSRVRVTLDSGEEFRADQEVPFGAAGRPHDDRRTVIEEKFRRETRYTLRKERVDRALEGWLHLEGATPTQVRELIRLGCSERRG